MSDVLGVGRAVFGRAVPAGAGPERAGAGRDGGTALPYFGPMRPKGPDSMRDLRRDVGMW
ncbi:hypothetical protein GCM10010371_26860 [Streptomyces subrutilus]|uniref:Uncharacterized protein n=1 Tax=Streptomyces subrutilus TaxID=36818 RepID=A0A918V359_9ACTN|nr:hypothetical protein GCM10010371_26860 [Streptomyces subrutilus]